MGTTIRALAFAACLLIGQGARADAPEAPPETDARGWRVGTVAANAEAVLSPRSEQPVITLPKALLAHIDGPTAIVYFSPRCPHCQDVQPELNALATRLDGKTTFIGVSSGASSAISVEEYRVEYAVPYPIIHDEDREISAAMAIRSTPSVLLVERRKKEVVVLDAFYPFVSGFDTILEARVVDDPWTVFRPDEYHGTAACSACHVQEADAWQLTHHAVAWHTLVDQREESNPECVVCHVIGAGKPGGYDAKTNPSMVDVGCEACHGPGGPHDGTDTVASEQCVLCHDAKHSIAFSYEKGLPLIDHFSTVEMNDTAYLERRQDLVEGTAARPLLAFETGEHVGALACKECHEEQHTAWSSSPHARAMATLTEHEGDPADAATSVACVRCHATANASGPPPATVEDYRVAESVSCESCHGPGAAHVTARGGTDNIQALGASCPVCVLEAVCTSCHTKKWDPDWDLDDQLPKVKH